METSPVPAPLSLPAALYAVHLDPERPPLGHVRAQSPAEAVTAYLHPGEAVCHSQPYAARPGVSIVLAAYLGIVQVSFFVERL